MVNILTRNTFLQGIASKNYITPRTNTITVFLVSWYFNKKTDGLASRKVKKNHSAASTSTNHGPHIHVSGYDKFASPVRLQCPVLKSRLQKTSGLKILRRGPVTRFCLSSFSCNRAPLFHTRHCLSPQIFSQRQRAVAPTFCSYLRRAGDRYKRKIQTQRTYLWHFRGKCFISTCGDRFVERFFAFIGGVCSFCFFCLYF